MPNITIDPKTGSPIINKSESDKSNIPPKGVTLIPPSPPIVLESIHNEIKHNGDSPTKRIQIAEALKSSGGDSMQQAKVYQSILDILNWK